MLVSLLKFIPRFVSVFVKRIGVLPINSEAVDEQTDVLGDKMIKFFTNKFKFIKVGKAITPDTEREGPMMSLKGNSTV